MTRASQAVGPQLGSDLWVFVGFVGPLGYRHCSARSGLLRFSRALSEVLTPITGMRIKAPAEQVLQDTSRSVVVKNLQERLMSSKAYEELGLRERLSLVGCKGESSPRLPNLMTRFLWM